jgi:hypothetical protein
MSLVTASPAFCVVTIDRGTANVDGDLSDWTGVTWNAFDKTYDSTPSDIAEGGWAAKWTADKIYMAVKVRDTAHHFTDTYDDWNTRDGIELYTHTTGTTGGYSDTQEIAQEWAVGMKTTADGALWKTVGYPTVYGAYTPTDTELKAAGKIDGQWLYYEAAITPYEYFGGRAGKTSVVSSLHEGQVIGLDCTAVGNNGVKTEANTTGYTGMMCSQLGRDNSLIGSWSADYSRFAQVTLVPEPSTVAFLVTGVLSLLAYAWRKRK